MVKRGYSTPGGTPRSAKRMRSMPTPSARKTIGKIARQAVIRMAEKKIWRVANSEQTISSAVLGNNFANLSAISQGGGWSDRVGKEVRLQKIDIKGLLHNNASGTHVVRMIVGYHKDINLGMSTTTELFESNANSGGPLTSVGIGGGDGVTALLLPINKAKFTVLVDRLIKVGANASIDGNNVRTFSVSKALKDAKITFEGTTTGSANQDKQLYIGFWTAEGGNDTAGGTTVEVSYISSLHFTDL